MGERAGLTVSGGSAAPFGLYIHIPFCRHKCFYCDFYSVTGEEDSIERYLNALTAEIKSWVKKLGRRECVSIFFGGGTPSLLDPGQIEKIIESCRAIFNVAVCAEITVEMNPESVTYEKLAGYLDAGINRASIGVESLVDIDLAFLERIHSADRAKGAIDLAFAAGFRKVSVDMIYMIPGQTIASWIKQLRTVVSLGVNSLSCYELTAEPRTMFGAKVLDGSIAMPECGEKFFDATENILSELDFDHYEISNYALPGFESVHNIGYWEYRDYIGLGAGASGKFGTRRWKNVESIDDYIAGVKREGRAVQIQESLTSEMIVTERLLNGLRLRDGMKFDGDILSAKTDQMIRDGLLEISGRNLKATARGWRILDSVMAHL